MGFYGPAWYLRTPSDAYASILFVFIIFNLELILLVQRSSWIKRQYIQVVITLTAYTMFQVVIGYRRLLHLRCNFKIPAIPWFWVFFGTEILPQFEMLNFLTKMFRWFKAILRLRNGLFLYARITGQIRISSNLIDCAFEVVRSFRSFPCF